MDTIRITLIQGFIDDINKFNTPANYSQSKLNDSILHLSSLLMSLPPEVRNCCHMHISGDNLTFEFNCNHIDK